MNSTKRRALFALFIGLMPVCGILLMASFQGTFLSAGIETDGNNATFINGWIKAKTYVNEYSTTGTTTLTAAQLRQRQVYYVSDLGTDADDDRIFNLPPCSVGAGGVWIDKDATSGCQIRLNPDDADKINGGTAGVSFDSGGTATESIELIGTSTGWEVLSKTGTWAAGS